MARQALSGFRIPVVTALPAAPVDGQEVKLKFLPTQTPATTVPLLWHLQWDAALAAWLPVGEQRPIKAIYYPGASVSMGSGSWGTYDANDPRLTVPLAGVYEIESGWSEAYGGGTVLNCGIAKNGTVSWEGGTPTATSGSGTTQVHADPQTLAVNDLIRQFYFLTAAGAQNIVMRGRYIQIKPMRIP